MSGDCPECGGSLIWGSPDRVPHPDTFHALMRRTLIRAVHHQLYRQIARRARLDRMHTP